MSNLLDDLFFKYRADKTPRIKHHYSDTYYELLKDKRDSVKKVLEIGTAEGASLFAWREFFPNATIYGMEIDQRRVDLMKGQDRIQVFQGDQSKPQDIFNIVEKIGADIDLIIEDGSHRPSDQLHTALMFLWLELNPTYIIEDVDDQSVKMLRALLGEYSLKEYHVGSRHDDRLILIEQ